MVCESRPLARVDSPRTMLDGHAMKNTQKVATTDRLILRHMVEGDAPYILELLNEPAFIKYVGDKNVRSEEDAIAYIENGPAKSYQDNGFGLYLVTLKDSLIPIGMCGLVKRAGLDDPDIGFGFSAAYGGKGYALEAAKATMAHAEQLQLRKVIAIADPANTPSVKLLAKIGLHFKEMIKLNDDADTVGYYCSN